MKTETVLFFAALIVMNMIVWTEAVGPGFIVGVVLTAIFFLILRKRR